MKHRSISIILLFIVSAMLIGVFAGCTETESKEYPLTQAELDAINNAWGSGTFAESIEDVGLLSGTEFIYGKYNNSIVLGWSGMLTEYSEFTVAGYKFEFPSSGGMRVYSQNTIYKVPEAYEKKILTDAQIEELWELHNARILHNSEYLLTKAELGMYDEYILTEEDLEELNEAFFQTLIYYEPSLKDLDESALNELRKMPQNMFAQTIEAAMSRPTSKPLNGGRYYIGKYGDCIVYFHLASDMSILWPDFLLYVCYDSRFYKLETALENGWMSDSEMKKIDDYCHQIAYYSSNQNSYNNGG